MTQPRQPADPAEIERTLDECAPSLRPAARSQLSAMYCAEKLTGTEGVSIDVGGTKIGIQQGASIHLLLRQSQAVRTLEIGFAFGFSTLWMLDALSARAGATHTAIDPFEKTHWGGVGLAAVERMAGPTPAFTWVMDLSIHALSAMIQQQREFDFIFIDGNHRFDDVLVDFYLADQVLAKGGMIAFDDMWLPAIQTVVSFIESNRAYKVVRQPAHNMAVFRKIADDQRPWYDFRQFKVPGGPPELTARQLLIRLLQAAGTHRPLRAMRDHLFRKQ